MFLKMGVPQNFAMFTEKHLCWSLFVIKWQQQVFLVNIAKIFGKAFSIETLRKLFLFSKH